MTLSIFTLFLSIVFACHPQCTYQCDNPVCNAVCKHVCLPPQCNKCITNPNTNATTCNQPILFGCSITCPADQCQNEHCPECTLHCNPNLCAGDPYCSIECQNIFCSWACQAPTDCPYPTCALHCEQPACQYEGNGITTTSSLLLMIITTLLMV